MSVFGLVLGFPSGSRVFLFLVLLSARFVQPQLQSLEVVG